MKLKSTGLFIASIIVIFLVIPIAHADELTCPKKTSRKWPADYACEIKIAKQGNIKAQETILFQLDYLDTSYAGYGVNYLKYLNAGVARNSKKIIEYKIKMLEKIKYHIQRNKQNIIDRKKLWHNESYRESFADTLAWEERQFKYLSEQFAAIDGDKTLQDLQQRLISLGDKTKIADLVGSMLKIDAPTKENRQKLISLLKDLKTTNSGASEFLIGVLFEQGKWVKHDTQKAIGYYQQAWAKGSGAAGFHLARHLLSQNSKKSTKQQAIKLLRESKKRLPSLNNPTHFQRMRSRERSSLVNSLLSPLIYETATNHAHQGNYEKAFKLYLESAQFGYQKSILAVAYLYRSGKGVPKNTSKTKRMANEKRFFEWAARCGVNSPHKSLQFERSICDVANNERRNIRDKENRISKNSLKLLALIGLVLISGDASGSTDEYKMPNIDDNAGIQMAAELMWLNKW